MFQSLVGRLQGLQLKDRAWCFMKRRLVLVILVSACMTAIFAGVGEDYERRLLSADLKKKRVLVTVNELNDSSLVQLYILAQFELRAWLAVKKYSKEGRLVYGLFGGEQRLDRVINELGDHYPLLIIAYCFENGHAACELPEVARKSIVPIERYFLGNPANQEEGRKIVRATSALLKLYFEGAHFIKDFTLLPNGTLQYKPIEQDSLQRIFRRDQIAAEVETRSLRAIQPAMIGRPALLMDRLTARKTKPIIDLHGAFFEGIQWGALWDAFDMYHLTTQIAPTIFPNKKTGSLEGFVYLLVRDPGIFSAGIARWSATRGKTLLTLQYLWWFALVSFIVYPGSLAIWLGKRSFILVVRLWCLFTWPFRTHGW
jgi:hypothetical protein